MLTPSELYLVFSFSNIKESTTMNRKNFIKQSALIDGCWLSSYLDLLHLQKGSKILGANDAISISVP